MSSLKVELVNDTNVSLHSEVIKQSRYKIKVRGSISRVVSGDLDQKAYDYWLAKYGEDDEITIVLEPDGLADYGVPDYANLFDDEYWDDVEHNIDHYGPVLGEHTHIWVTDENGDDVIDSIFDANSFDNLKINYIYTNIYDLASLSNNEHIYVIERGEYGESFEGLVTDVAFDISKLKISIVNVYGIEIVESITYDGIQIDLKVYGSVIETNTDIRIY